MKRKYVATSFFLASILTFGGLVGCTPPITSTSEVKEFYFTAVLDTGANFMNLGTTAKVVISEYNGDENITRRYSYMSTDTSLVTVTEDGTVAASATKEGKAILVVTEEVSNYSVSIDIEVIDAKLAKGGYTYASLAGAEAIAKREEILGRLEKYAMDKHLTGITLFENGGYVKYSSRVTIPAREYITGYGFGLLSEGSVEGKLPGEQNDNHQPYLHTAQSSDPKMINARDNTGSQVSDLEGYITSSFWGTKMNATKDKYEWYPVLARDTIKVNGQDVKFDRPVPVQDGQEILTGNEPNANPLGLYRTWRIYVKTGANSGIKYRYTGASWGTEFDKRDVALEDYEFAYFNLLTASHQLTRGSEMAADKTYGIKGALSYFNMTKNATDEEAVSYWNKLKSQNKLGIKTGTDATNGDYIEVTILNSIDKFTAMYTLSSNLLSPLPRDFIRTIGSGSVKDGSPLYGTFNNSPAAPTGHFNRITDYVLSVGPYMLEEWNKEQTILFKKNDLWNEPGRYNIKGIKMYIIETSNDVDAIYKQFKAGLLDQCGVPAKHFKEEKNQAGVRQTRGDSTFKLNVNSCTQEEFDRLNEKQWTPKNGRKSNWPIKPWMSNNNFLNGLFYSINRKQFAENRGSNPSINYFADSYLSDPENGIPYNDSQAHKDAIAAYDIRNSKGESEFGYSKDRAVASFKAAVNELVASGAIIKGTKTKPTEISIKIWWMYPTDLQEYGDEIKGYFTDAFNNEAVSGGTVKLVVEQEAPKNWMDVYEQHLMTGEFDLGFGAISGNTYNPLNFLEVLKSDNSSGFTLNWGTNTAKVDAAKPLIYDKKIWSFDALWAAADHGAVVDNGELIDSVKKAYLEYNGNDFYNGANFSVDVNFFEDPNETVKFEVSAMSLFINGSGPREITFVQDENNPNKYNISISKEDAQEINHEMMRVHHWLPEDEPANPDTTPFNVDKYDVYWNIEVTYRMYIKDPVSGQWGTPTESFVNPAKNQYAWDIDHGGDK